jgi:hypothetical protein
VVIDEPDHVEAIGHDTRIGEVLTHERAVHTRQIDAHDPNQVLALKAVQIAFQRRLAAPQYHIMDAMSSEIAERGGVAITA